MPRITRLWLVLCLVVAGAAAAMAQQNPEEVTGPPKVLVVVREFLKPGKAGSPHVKTESAFVNAFAAAKWPTHYLAMDSLSGVSRSLFMIGYDSFEAWEKDNLGTMNNPTLFAALDRASIADGDLLTSTESSTFLYREDYSLRAKVNVAQMRYFEISRFHVRPGHQKDWEALVKMYISGYEKAVANGRWAVFEDMYGHNSGGTYLVIVPMKSLAETDRGFTDSKQFAAAIGEDGMKKLAELEAACVDAAETNVFMFNPKMSYVSDKWIAADPAFWKPKAPSAGKKSEPKPAQ
ncbi:MAG TPA: hypothetical protein VEG30_02350 [Terriglobales bacterium]|nr:hypothetical protein [Terriglobales bacterium]